MTELLNGRRGGNKAKDHEDNRHDGLVTSFVQRDQRTVRCYNCKRFGHYARDCTMRSDDQDQESGRLINIDANAHASAFQLSDTLDSDRPGNSGYCSHQSNIHALGLLKSWT